MKAVFTLSLLATSFAGCAASADAHNGLVRRAAGHALPAKRFEKRTIRLGARAEIPDVGYLSVSANASSATSSDLSTSTMVISNSSEAVWVNGTALWYNSTGLGGSCKVGYNSTDLLVSLPASFYPDKAVVSPLCGEQVLIKDLASGNNVSAIVSDTSSNEYLVLSNSAFQVLSDLAVGMLDVQYYFYNSSINATLPATSSSAAPLVPSSTAVARVASTQAPTTTEAPQTTTTPAYDYASASSASKASADAAWASSSSAQAAASKSSADAAWAASSSSSSAAAAAANTASSSSASSSSKTYTGGYATYFLQNGNPGHCGTVAQESDKVIALPTVTYANGAHCGQQILITRTDTGAQVTATVRDSCPTCVNNESLDLSQGAFTAIATESEGMVPIEWYFL